MGLAQVVLGIVFCSNGFKTSRVRASILVEMDLRQVGFGIVSWLKWI